MYNGQKHKVLEHMEMEHFVAPQQDYQTMSLYLQEVITTWAKTSKWGGLRGSIVPAPLYMSVGGQQYHTSKM
jgi:hypothetical protein